MSTIVLAHGAWSAVWAWKKMRPLFKQAGHAFYSPTYTGLGERARTEPGWKCHEIEASHNPHITCPNLLMATLTQIMAGQS